VQAGTGRLAPYRFYDIAGAWHLAAYWSYFVPQPLSPNRGEGGTWLVVCLYLGRLSSCERTSVVG
jgi:hypothetical protein